jgi:hypothetical protein
MKIAIYPQTVLVTDFKTIGIGFIYRGYRNYFLALYTNPTSHFQLIVATEEKENKALVFHR